MKKVIYAFFALGLMAVLSFDLGYCAVPESVKEFYQNNTVTFIVPYGTGGGTDACARIMAFNWKAVTGGTMMVKNVPGAAGFLGTNQIYNMKPDGLTLGYIDSATTLLGAILLKNPGIQFDATKFVYIGANAIQPNGIGIGKGLAAESIGDLQKMKGLKFGVLTVDAQAMGSAMTIELFGLKDGRIITGYNVMEEVGLACARGELDASSNSMASMADHVKKGFLKKVVLVYDYKRNPYFPDAPTPMELVKFTPEQEMLFKMVFACRAAKPIFTSPGLPKEKTDFLRDAFEKIFRLETYLNQMKVRWPIIDPGFHMTGEEWAKMTNEVMGFPAAERDKCIALVSKYHK